MRKSSTKARLGYAGLSIGAVGAALLVAPQAAWAGVGTTTPFVTNASTKVAINDAAVSGAGAAFTNTSVATVTANTSCAATYAAPTGTTYAATVDTVSVTANRVEVTLPGPGSLTPNANGVPKVYMICVYVSNTVGAALQSSSSVAIGPAPGLSSTAGPTGGGNTLTVTSASTNAIFTGVSSIGAFFTTANCPTSYGTPTANLVATDITRNSNTQATLGVPAGVVSATTAPRAPVSYNLCMYNGNTSAGTLVSSAPYAVGAATLAPASGANASGTGITVNFTVNALAGVTAPGILFTKNVAGCPSTYDTTAGATNTTHTVALTDSTADVRKIADNKLALTTPTLTLTGGNPTPFQLCVYGGIAEESSALLASSTYTAATAATPTGVNPAAGPATGGTEITVSGIGFPTAPGTITATLGGVPLINVTPFSDTAFTATTPRHSPETNSALVVTTPYGTKVLQNAFSFQNALKVTPSTAPNTSTAVNVEVTGSNFLSYTFTGGSTRARVFLVDGVYNPRIVTGSGRANGPVADCTGVLVLSDETLVCTLRLDKRLDASAGLSLFDPVAYSNNAVAVAFTVGSPVIDIDRTTLDNPATNVFSPNDVGQVIVEDTPTNIPAAGANQLTIIQVLSPTRAVMSGNATGNGTPADLLDAPVNIGNVAVKSIAAGGGTGINISGANVRTVTAPAGTFSTADVGRQFGNSTTGITNGTTIIAVTPNGASATLSANTTGSASAAAAYIYPSGQVRNGAYILTVVSNGAVDANTTDPTYQQSAVTSGAVFTVAPA